MSRQSRMEILGRLRGKQRTQVGPQHAWRSRRDFADLAARFGEAFQAAGGEVVRIKDRAAALDGLVARLADLNIARLVVNGDSQCAGADLLARLTPWSPFVVGQSSGDVRAACAAADAGLSGVEAALAETGTLVVASGQSLSRLATLLPPVHLALVPTSVLTADLFTWTAARQAPPPAHVTLISGPSKTADIEMTLAIGVHGPGQVIAFLYDD